MEEHSVIPGEHSRLFVRRCSCGFQTSSPSVQGAIDGMSGHLQHVLGPRRVGPKTWAPLTATIEERAS